MLHVGALGHLSKLTRDFNKAEVPLDKHSLAIRVVRE